MKTLRRGLVIAALAAVAAAVWAWNSLSAPHRGFSDEVFLTFERGSSTRSIARKLADAGIIRYPWQFLIMRAIDPKSTLQAGEYRFTDAASVRDVFHRIARGDVYHFDFTVPEGSNMFDIARMLEADEVMSAEDFLRAAADPALVRDLAPTAKTLEGYLFPSTYQLSHSTTAADLCRMMTHEFRRQWPKVAQSAQASVHEAVTMASLIEKETGVAEERAIVASVFVNRLKKPMRLDCDPTVIYAAILEKRYNGAIHRSDLDRRSPYNTYQSDGLPPGPIANPGAASLGAALHPAETDYLYFVAKPEGGSHVFSATLAAHEKAVASYRHGSRSQNTGKPALRPVRAKAARKAG
jgi:UPF0755 protein